MQTESAFTSFLKLWMLNNTPGFCLQLFHCNVLQIFIFHHIYFLARDVFFLPPHWLAVSTMTYCDEKISKVAIFITMLNRRNREYNLYDWFQQKEQLSALYLSQTWETTQTLGYWQGAKTTSKQQVNIKRMFNSIWTNAVFRYIVF